MDESRSRERLMPKAERAYLGLRMASGRMGKVRRWLGTTNKDGWNKEMKTLAEETMVKLCDSLECLKSAEGFLSAFLVRVKCRSMNTGEKKEQEHGRKA